MENYAKKADEVTKIALVRADEVTRMVIEEMDDFERVDFIQVLRDNLNQQKAISKDKLKSQIAELTDRLERLENTNI